ncbi:hypothetical protein [Actinomadura sp. K4S16]|uniref:hypothetical protein n=1 Tax=Actinomadura sp. K4S16 TaxID=1316147 RepID=UPI0011EF8DCA|nr:hypothetical protein [Actinomadura sp. K4S16]
MTAKTTKGGADEVEAVPAEEAREETEARGTAAAESGAAGPEAAEPAAKPAARRKRRVRVIEVIDDEDLDEVLEALDAEDEEAEGEAPARPAKAAKPAARAAAEAPAEAPAKPAAKPKPRPSRLEPPEDEAEEEEAPKKAPARPRSAASAEDRPGVFGLGMVQAVVVVVVVALLASLAIWQWTSASSLSSKQDDREAVGKVASAYGDVAYNYNASNYQAMTAKAQKLLAGDLLEEYKKNTVPTVAGAFQADPSVVLTSKTNQVFVGSVDERFATAVIMMDVSLKTKDGAVNQPATLLRLALAKIDGNWRITRQYPSGVNDENKNQQQNQLPAVPGGGASKSPKAEKSDKPKN